MEVDETIVAVESDGVVINEGGGWKDGGAGSSPLPVNILSVVDCTLPLFRCKSHMISLLLSCGNTCAIWSTCAEVKRIPGVVPLGVVEDVDEESLVAAEEKK